MALIAVLLVGNDEWGGLPQGLVGFLFRADRGVCFVMFRQWIVSLTLALSRRERARVIFNTYVDLKALP
ncbi:hypothetical protein CRX57_25070 [Pseudomonas putida]|uniref:Uncharacterized protein n=1 Tax=Pseudomonas putida TaxID=303 RepID=A0A2C5WF92_PSEPU|nr:hypothetical protein CRX57_25070 [Pseudomonas putida]